MQDLGLRDYARIDGFVLLPLKAVTAPEKPEGLANYQVRFLCVLSHCFWSILSLCFQPSRSLGPSGETRVDQ